MLKLDRMLFFPSTNRVLDRNAIPGAAFGGNVPFRMAMGPLPNALSL